jgi:hypothetical protein
MERSLIFGGVGLVVLALVLWAIRTGWYPSHGRRITRTDNPITFWSVMAGGTVFGVLFLIFAVALSSQ